LGNAPLPQSKPQAGIAGTLSHRDSDRQQRTGTPKTGRDNAGTAASSENPTAPNRTQNSQSRQRGNERVAAPLQQTKPDLGAAPPTPREQTPRSAKARRQTQDTHIPGVAGTTSIASTTRAQTARAQTGGAFARGEDARRSERAFGESRKRDLEQSAPTAPNAYRSSPGIAGNAKSPKTRRKRGRR
jgi:hypothetical protein